MSFIINEKGEYIPVLGEPPSEGIDFDVITTLTSGATDTQVPSAKCVYNELKTTLIAVQYGTIKIEV